jgi:hypothetical protein
MPKFLLTYCQAKLKSQKDNPVKRPRELNTEEVVPVFPPRFVKYSSRVSGFLYI